jgi:hypothetical protein
MRFSVAVLLAALVLAAFLSRSSEKEGFWSNAKGYIAMSGSRFPGNTIGTGFGGTAVAAAACTAKAGCAGFMIKRGKKTKGSERPYWLVDASVLVGSNRQKNGAWTTYMKKARRDALKITESPGYNQAAVQATTHSASTPSPAPTSQPASTPVCSGRVTIWEDVYVGPEASRLGKLGQGKGASNSYDCGDYPNIGSMWNDKIGGIEVPPGLKVDIYEGTNFENLIRTVRPLKPDAYSHSGLVQTGNVNKMPPNAGISSFKVAADV